MDSVGGVVTLFITTFFAYFSSEIFDLFRFIFRHSLCIIDINPLSIMCIANIFFSLFFLSLDFGYEAFFHMEVLDFNMVKIIQVFFPVCTFHILFKKSFPTMFWFKTSLYYL